MTKLSEIQRVLGVTADDVWGPETAAALAKALGITGGARAGAFAAVTRTPGVPKDLWSDPGNITAFNNMLDAWGAQIEGATAEHRLGVLSEKYESGGNGPGTVSSGKNDPGGVSYGTYQLASKTGTAATFVAKEGASWPELAKSVPGSAEFSAAWRKIADSDSDGVAFGDAQHEFIKRTHYDPAVRAVRDMTGVDLDQFPLAIRNVVWSVAVQHGGAAKIMIAAIAAVGGDARHLIDAIYDARIAYVKKVNLAANVLKSLTNRYRDERTDALAMMEAG